MARPKHLLCHQLANEAENGYKSSVFAAYNASRIAADWIPACQPTTHCLVHRESEGVPRSHFASETYFDRFE